MTAIIDYGMGNLRSVEKACEYLGFSAHITRDAAEILSADHVILPGVGAFAQAADALKRLGLDQLLLDLHANQTPILGICLGMQLLFARSAEGGVRGLGIFPDDIIAFERPLTVPQMGWNSITALDPVLFRGIPEGSYVYFVHSYHAPMIADYTAARCCYGELYTCAARRGNTFATQFHPEKSGETGLKILNNFLKV